MNSYRSIGIALLAGALLLAGFAGNALALTAACQTISNQATLTYSVGGSSSFSLNSDNDADATNGLNPTTFDVGSKVDVLVSIAAPAKVLTANTDQDLIFLVTNQGNDTQRYELRLFIGANGDTFGVNTDDFDMDPTKIRVYVDTTPDGAVDGSETVYTFSASGAVLTNVANANLTPDVPGNVGVAPGNTVEVIVRADTGVTVNNYAMYSLQAISYQKASIGAVLTEDTDEPGGTSNSCGQPIVEADTPAVATGVGGVSDAQYDGNHHATGYYVAAKVTVQKGYTIVYDPVNAAPPYVAIPLARVRYTLTLTNTGGAAASSLVLIDPIPNVAPGSKVMDYYVAGNGGSLGATFDYSKDGGGTWVPAATADGNGVDAAVTHVRATIPALAAGASGTVWFEAVIK